MRDSPNIFLVLVLVVSAAVGAGEALVPASRTPLGSLAFPHMIASAILFFGWCKAHARSSGIQEPSGSALLCGLLAVVGVPLYFFRGFGIKKGFIGTAKAIGFFILMVLAYGIPNTAIRYAGS